LQAGKGGGSGENDPATTISPDQRQGTGRKLIAWSRAVPDLLPSHDRGLPNSLTRGIMPPYRF